MSDVTTELICPPLKPKSPEVQAFLQRLLSYDKIVIFSPHLDDTLLCAGGLLSELVKHRQNIINYNIYTVCSPLRTENIDLRFKLAGIESWETYSAMRQKEDQEAFDALGGVQVVNLGFIDSLWRYDKNNQPLYHAAFSPIHDLDIHIALLEEKIKELTAQPNTLVFSPLARGRHVDHLITRTIVSKLGIDAVYYMDFPYAQRYPEETDFIAENNLLAIEWPGPYQQKVELLKYYASQHESLFRYQSTPDSNTFPLDYERFYVNFAF